MSAHEKLEKEQEYTEGYSQDGRTYNGRAMRGNGTNGYSQRDGWYITREDDRQMRGGRYPYNSYGEPSVDRIAEAVRMAMRNEG